MAVRQLDDCSLTVASGDWPFAVEHAEAIACNWADALSRNENLFNGDVFILDRWTVNRGQLRGVALRAKFAAYLYWRSAGEAGAQYDEAFTTAMVISNDRGVMLARSVAGTLNEGFYGAPGGLLDARDIDASGRIDIAGAAARELREETGLCTAILGRQPGFLLARVGAYLAVTSVFQSNLDGDDLLSRVTGFLGEQDNPELEEPRIVYDQAELSELPLTPFAGLLTRHVLGM